MKTLSLIILYLLEGSLNILSYFRHLFAYLLLDGTPPVTVHYPTQTAHPAVMITRAGSGAGRDIALYLAKQGYTVLAGVRNQEEGEQLEELMKSGFLEDWNSGGSILPVLVDLSTPSTIIEARNFISNTLKELRVPLVALVNNSGVNISLPNELMSHAYVKHALEVRLFGAVKLTRELIPLLSESKGRILNIGSMTRWILYRNAQSHEPIQRAVDLLSDVWQKELRKVGVFSCMIEPGVYRSVFQDSSQKIVTEDFVDLAETIFTEMLDDSMLKYYIHGLDGMSSRIEHLARVAPTPELVIHALVHGLTSRWPKSVYTVGWDAYLHKFIKATIG